MKTSVMPTIARLIHILYGVR